MDPKQYLLSLGTGAVVHNSGEDFFRHLEAVQETMKSLTNDKDLINAGLFHSIYGTEGFQAFTVSLNKRPQIRELIGERAEQICYVNCVMDRATLDASLDHSSSRKTVEARKEVGGAKIELDEQQFRDLISVHLGDWLQQVEMEAGMINERHGWYKIGDAWGYRRHAFRKMAEILGGTYLKLYDDVFGRETESTKHIHQKVTPPIFPQTPKSPVLAV